MTLQVNAEDLHEDALERWFATYLLKGYCRRESLTGVLTPFLVG